ncbi:hypothetical protein M758_UG339100 [Ceratodon purpureus]|nr:hypothetical protein M758_UG339100 [Ceratodon purpureus]
MALLVRLGKVRVQEVGAREDFLCIAFVIALCLLSCSMRRTLWLKHWSSCHPHNSPHLYSTAPRPPLPPLNFVLHCSSHLTSHVTTKLQLGSPPRRTLAKRPSPCASGSLAVS